MISQVPRSRPGALEQRWPPVATVLPYAMLAFCVLLDVLVDGSNRTALYVTPASACWPRRGCCGCSRCTRPGGTACRGCMFARDPEFEVLGEAADGAEAVRLARDLRPDVILMDLRMPGVDGLTAITELARQGIPTRVLVLTTYDTDSHVLPAIEAGATGYLLKDAPRAELLRAVRAAAHGEAVLSPSVAARLMSRFRRPARARSASESSRFSSWWRLGPPTGRRPPGCSSPRPRSRPTC